MIQFTIGITPRTKKNSQQIIMCKGRPMIVPSKAYKQYEKDSRYFMPKIETIDYPVNIKCLFYMPTRRRVDITNLLNSIMDVLVAHGVIKDDNRNIVYSTDGSRVLYSKEHPRTEVTITKIEESVDVWGKR